MTTLKSPHELLADLDTEERGLKARLLEIERLRAATAAYLTALESVPKSLGSGHDKPRLKPEVEVNVQKRPPPPPPKRRKRRGPRAILPHNLPATAGELLAKYEAMQQNSDMEK